MLKTMLFYGFWGITLALNVSGQTTFRDISELAYIHDSHSAYGSACADINNDGWLDIYVCNTDYGNLLYLNSQDNRFRLATQEYGLFESVKNYYSYCPSWIDIENNGDLDLFITNQYHVNSLYLNKGNEWFVDVGLDRGFDEMAASIRSAWADFDNDGDLDCYLVNWLSPNKLFQNDAGYFFDIAPELGINSTSYGRSALWFDYDNDGDPDLYVTNSKGQPDKLYRNDSGSAFTDMTENLGLLANVSSIGVASADFDNDRDSDLYIAGGWYEPDRLYINLGGDGFRRIDVSVGIQDDQADTDVSWIDYDNDGDLDIYVVNQRGQNRLYENSDGQFVDVAHNVNLDDAGVGLSAVWADFNRDGFLDVFVANGNSQPNRMFLNSGNSNNWLTLSLKGTVTNVQAVGTKVTLYAGDYFAFREVQAGWGFVSQGSLELEFGIGKKTRIDSIKIEWPSGIKQTFLDVSANQQLTIIEESPDFVYLSKELQPGKFVLKAFPNPFNSSTRLEFDNPFEDEPTIRIANILGESVKKFSCNWEGSSSRNSVVWDGRDDSGKPLPTGIYFAILISERARSVIKLIILR